MRRKRLLSSLSIVVVVLLTFAPAALAHGGGGQGWYGETDDQAVTNVMFITIAFFPTVAIVFSLIQWRLEKRKHAHMDAEKHRASSVDWRGGW
jgi:preprotein translocase subunit SecG